MARVTSQAPDPSGDNGVPEIHRRRRWTFVEKLRAAREACVPGSNVSSVARKYGVAPSQLFRWRKLILNLGVETATVEDQALVITEMRELKRQVRELERLLGKKTLENETLREAMAVGKSKLTGVPMMGDHDRIQTHSD